METDELNDQPIKEKPPRVRPEIVEDMGDADEPEKKRGLFNNDLIKPIIIAFVVSFLVITGLGMMGGGEFLTKKQFEKNLTGLTETVTKSIATADKKQAEINTTLQNLPNQVNDQVSKITSNSLANLSTQLTGVTSQISKLNNDLTSVQSSLTKVNETSLKVDGINTTLTKSINDQSTKITSLETLLKDQNTKLIAMETKIITDEAKIKELETKLTTTATTSGTNSSSPSSSSTYNNVTATLINNWVTNSTYYSVSTISASGTTIPFNFTLANNTGKNISSINLMVGFYSMNASGSSSLNLPATMTTNLSTVGLTPQWVAQTTGNASILAFVTSNTNSLFNLFNFTQGTGTVTYTVNLILTSTTGADLIGTTYMIFPVIKVNGFTAS